MATGELIPTHFPARRAAQVALHHLNTHHGSPFRVFGLQQVHTATAEDQVRPAHTHTHFSSDAREGKAGAELHSTQISEYIQ